MIREMIHFFLHLRLHYQFFLLSGGFLLGGLMADTMDVFSFWLQFVNVYVLLFGGATAYNSFWDKDEGPIGGLKHPPKMAPWMHPVSLLLMIAGWLLSLQAGWLFFFVYAVSFGLFWLYSTPLARWKGRPHLSLIAISLSTGFNSVLLGALAAGGSFSWNLILAATGASLILLSLYPVSQVYQLQEDTRRGDVTFTARYGLYGVKRFFTWSWFLGLVLLSAGIYTLYTIPAFILFILGSTLGGIIGKILARLKGDENEYDHIMKVKYIASASFVIFLLASNAIRYGWISADFLKTFFE